MFQFDPNQYCQPFPALLDPARPDDLGPGQPNRAVRDQLAALTPELAFDSQSIVDRRAARCCIAGVWLLHNYFDESHTISQEIETANGSYWHGILHRREPDYSNAKYWFRRVGSHPIFPQLAAQAKRLAEAEKSLDASAKFLAEGAAWDPFRFVDLCEQVARGKSSARQLCLAVQRLEWQLLFDHCYREAVG